LRTSVEIEKELQSTHEHLQNAEKRLLEAKKILVQKIEEVFPRFVESVVDSVVSENSTRISKMSEEEIRKMKRELNEAKPKAIQETIQAFSSSDYWLKCESLHVSSGKDPIGYFGVNEEGPLWKMLEAYREPFVLVFAKYALKTDEQSTSGYRLDLTRLAYHFLKDRGLEEFNKSLGKAHREYCETRFKLESWERKLDRAKALEKFSKA
jgi:hypothetical protein